MAVKTKNKIASCYQCAGLSFCYGSKNPVLARHEARSAASKCLSLRKGCPNETITVLCYNKGLSRKNAEKLVVNGLARWHSFKTITPIHQLPLNIYKRLIKDQ